MKDKEKQITEIVRFIDTNIMAKKIAELIPSKIVSYDGRSKGQHLYIEQKMEIAKEMMKQGVVVWTMDEHAKLVAQVRQEFEQEYKDSVVLSREEYNEYVELRNSEVAELVKENKVLGKQCLDWMKLYHKQLTKTKEASKETAEKILNELLVGFRKNFYLKNMSMTEEEFGWVIDEIAREFDVEIKE
jgi:hypothetical protein